MRSFVDNMKCEGTHMCRSYLFKNNHLKGRWLAKNAFFCFSSLTHFVNKIVVNRQRRRERRKRQKSVFDQIQFINRTMLTCVVASHVFLLLLIVQKCATIPNFYMYMGSIQCYFLWFIIRMNFLPLQQRHTERRWAMPQNSKESHQSRCHEINSS